MRFLFALLLAVATAAFAPGASAQTRAEALAALKSPDAPARQKAVVRLAEIGTMADAPPLVEALHDRDELTRALAEQALWMIWGRSGDPKIDALYERGVQEMGAGQFRQGIATFSEVIRRKPGFAEGWNKRATLYYLAGDYKRSLADCDEVMKRNPYHFGALAGYGQIYFRLDQPEKSLEYFRKALAVNPNMEGVRMSIDGLQRLLEEKRGKMI
jgi:tetratricopeptide (TPR) repeat protein